MSQQATSLTPPGRYEHIHPVPHLPGFAARVEGVDLRRPLSEGVRKELYQALLEFEVLLLPPQALTPDQHTELASVFGPLASGAFFPRKDGHPFLEVIEFNEQRKPEIDVWHSDLTWLPEPPAGTVIQITELPEQGGSTSWTSLSKAYAGLSEGYRQFLADKTATHTWEISGWRNALANVGEEALIKALQLYKPVSHPVVRTHPESGKPVLFVNENFTKHIDGLHFRESRAVLEFLREWIVQPQFVYTHKWEKNGIAIWDNRTTQHFAAADYWPARRITHRVTFNPRSAAVVGQSTHGKVFEGALITPTSENAIA